MDSREVAKECQDLKIALDRRPSRLEGEPLDNVDSFLRHFNLLLNYKQELKERRQLPSDDFNIDLNDTLSQCCIVDPDTKDAVVAEKIKTGLLA